MFYSKYSVITIENCAPIYFDKKKVDFKIKSYCYPIHFIPVSVDRRDRREDQLRGSVSSDRNRMGMVFNGEYFAPLIGVRRARHHLDDERFSWTLNVEKETHNRKL